MLSRSVELTPIRGISTIGISVGKRLTIVGPGMILNVPEDIKGKWVFHVLCGNNHDKVHLITAECHIPVNTPSLKGFAFEFDEKLDKCCRDMDVVISSREILEALINNQLVGTVQEAAERELDRKAN